MMVRTTPWHQRGGVEDHTMMLARGMAAGGHEVAVLSTALPGSPAPVTDGIVTVHHLPGTFPGRLDRAWRAASSAALRRLHAESPFDIFHSQGPAGYPALLDETPRALHIASAASCHGTAYDELVTRWRAGFSADPMRSARNVAALAIVLRKFLWTEARALHRADGVIATSNEQEAILRKTYKLPGVHTVFNGMDTSAFTPGSPPLGIRERFGIPPDARVLLAVARLIHDKGVQYAVRALPLIQEEFPAAYLLVIGDGGYRPALEDLARRLGVARSVCFAGALAYEELPACFRLCELFVNSTVQQNGYDLTMVEAMACAKCVVASRIGSVPTLISDGTDGLLVRPGKAHELAAAAAELLRDPQRGRAIGAAARRKVLGRFTLEAMVDGTLAVYGALRGNRR